MRTVNVKEAKATLSALIQAAENGETTIVTKHGRPVARIVPSSDASEAGHKPSFAELLLSIPHEIPFERDPTPPREVEF